MQITVVTVSLQEPVAVLIVFRDAAIVATDAAQCTAEFAVFSAETDITVAVRWVFAIEFGRGHVRETDYARLEHHAAEQNDGAVPTVFEIDSIEEM